MRVEDLQEQMSGAGTLRHGYQVVWNGTTGSASGTPYLATDELPATPVLTETRAAIVVLRSTLRSAILAEIEARGPQTIRALAIAVRGRYESVKLAVYNMKKAGYVREQGQTTIRVDRFGDRLVKLYGLAS
mgnify:CR=1 FL=1